MKALFIGGTGNISASCSRLAVASGIDLHLLNRHGTGTDIPGARHMRADMRDGKKCAEILADEKWDCVVNWIAYGIEDVERDIRIFSGNAGQYIFISSASVYQKPPVSPFVTENTPLSNPFWEYSRKKIACEQRLMEEFRTNGFPATIVRPSHTYDTVIPLSVGGWKDYTVVARMKEGRRIIVHGDGTSLWTLTHSADFARGFAGLIGNRNALGEAFHITSDEVLSWNQIYETVADAASATADIVHIPSDFLIAASERLGYGDQRGSLLGDKAHSLIFDNSKIRRVVPGYKAAIPFTEGIRRTLQWFGQDPSRTAVNPRTNEMFDAIIAAYGH